MLLANGNGLNLNFLQQLTSRRNDHDRVRSKLKERWNKECKKLVSIVNKILVCIFLPVEEKSELSRTLCIKAWAARTLWA